MLKHLISLVFLFVTLYSTAVLSDTKSLILPKIKPHKMSITNKVKTSIILPAKKPKIKIEVVTVKKIYCLKISQKLRNLLKHQKKR